MERLSPHLGPLRPFSSVGWKEQRYVATALRHPLSGYLGGVHKGGYWVERLGAEWASTFGVRNAVPCNSATSGLLAACMVARIKPGDLVLCPVYSMSATASCAKILGADVRFIDIEARRYSMRPDMLPQDRKPKAIIVTNLFGHPAYLHELRRWCDRYGVYMIEDNAQGIFAKIGKDYAGTVGHMGVFSLNVHKGVQTGEGGIIVTNEDSMALALKDAINHGELRKDGMMGLNLRMTEPIAAIGCAQLIKASELISQRRELAIEMSEHLDGFDGIHPPLEGLSSTSSFYQWAVRVTNGKRNQLVMQLNWHGVPVNPGYSPLLSDIFPSVGNWPIARALEDQELMTFELALYSLSTKQRKTLMKILQIVGERVSQIKGGLS